MDGGVNNLDYLIALNEFSKFGPRSMQRLFKVFKNPKCIFEASVSNLTSAGIKETAAKEFAEFRSKVNLRELLDLVEKNSLSVISIFDDHYPALLREIYDPPTILFMQGNLPDLSDRKLLGIVGSRKASPYGKQISRNLTREIAKSGIITVSGLAYGIDESAHKSTIEVGGQTIAVLGFGMLHKSTTREHSMRNHILKSGGAIISEFPLKMHGQRQNFPIRNRIISGMSHGTLVVEAAIKSGSLITARSAMEQNREVFAIPGPITSEISEGTNNLIKNGAHCVTSIEDILEPLEIDRIISAAKIKIVPKGETPEETTILKILSQQPTHIDDITEQSKLPPHAVASTLSILELRGAIQNLGGERYFI